MSKSDIIVSISCITYNHVEFIEDALKGFLMQKTNFRFEILIHDDASTDGTTEIIEKYTALYPDIIYPLYEEENQWVKGRRGSAVFNFPRAKGKYVALCEGDDYWIDPYKLQRQVDFLEAHPDYGLVYGKAKIYHQNKQEFVGTCGEFFTDFKELVLGNKIPTLTSMFRKSLYESYYQDILPDTKDWKMGDYPMWLYFSYKSKINFEDKITAVYRILNNSASHSDNIVKSIDFIDSTVDIQLFFSHKYNLDFVDIIKLQRIYNISHLVINSEKYDYFEVFRKEMYAIKIKPLKLRIFIFLSYYPYFFKFSMKVRSFCSRIFFL